MSRMEINALTSLIGMREAGGYDLPTELVGAYRTYERTRALVAAEPPALDVDSAAARVVSATAAGNEPDLLQAGRDLEEADRDRRATERARAVLAAAVEQAAHSATLLAADLTERIITEHLRPVHDDVLAQARQAAEELGGHRLNLHTLVTAPAKARNAYARLSELAARRSAVLNARHKANTLGHRTPEHDAARLFATFQDPMTFHPRWKPPAQIPRIPSPEDDKLRLLWLVGPEATAAKPWLPTVAEQDTAWWEMFGEGVEHRQRLHRDERPPARL